MVNVAFKEWAAVCGAMASGSQTLILRKGGIAETDGAFRPEHSEFLLYPTFFHEQQQKGLKPSAASFLAAAEADRPGKGAEGTIRFRHLARVDRVIRANNLDPLLKLDPFHVWTAETVTQRFHYRTPGLYVLLVRVFELVEPVERIEEPSYAGCKTWVELKEAVSTDGATPVLNGRDYDAMVDSVAAVMAEINASN